MPVDGTVISKQAARVIKMLQRRLNFYIPHTKPKKTTLEYWNDLKNILSEVHMFNANQIGAVSVYNK
jgi:hypothetical protein